MWSCFYNCNKNILIKKPSDISLNRGSQLPGSGPPSNRDEVMIMVPNSAVGALIGSNGSHIKQIIRDTNAHVTVSELLLLERVIKVPLKWFHEFCG